ncbi:MAG: hypothetical protein ACKVVT_08970 [Dehalococcoidia bacterium]
MTPLGARFVPNWTTAAGAVEGVLAFLETPLARHAVMGLTGHAFRLCLGAKAGVVALPSGPHDLDWERMVREYARTGWRWERFGALLAPEDDWEPAREAAVAWTQAHLEAGRPVTGFDFHVREHGVIYGVDVVRGGFLVDDITSAGGSGFAPWAEWPTAVGMIELAAPVEPLDLDPLEVIGESLAWATECLAGRDGPADGQPRGTGALRAWADAFDATTEVDRAGNAYTLAILQAARLDGATFLGDLAGAIPELEAPLRLAERALRDEAKTLAGLLTLFPFPSGGHGNVTVPGLRRGAAMNLRSAATFEDRAHEAIREALRILD